MGGGCEGRGVGEEKGKFSSFVKVGCGGSGGGGSGSDDGGLERRMIIIVQ